MADFKSGNRCIGDVVTEPTRALTPPTDVIQGAVGRGMFFKMYFFFFF